MLVPRHAHTRSLSGLWLASCLLAAVSCASLPPVPGAGGPRWLQLTNEHSVLLTDQPEAQAQKESESIELQHTALCKVAFRCDAQPRQPLRVIALHDAGQFEQLYGSEQSGAFSPELVYTPQLVLATGLSQAGLAQLSRVLTALIARETIGPVPTWLTSGLSSYYETAHFDAGGAFVVGDAVRRHVEQLGTQPRVRTELLLTQQPSAAGALDFAASAWLLVHYLQSERRADFEALLDSLGSGQELSRAFHEAFPDLAPELLDGLLDRYQRAGNYLTQSRRVAAQPRAAHVTPLSDADVYSLRAEVAATCSPCSEAQRERSQKQLALALSLQPEHVRAQILKSELDANAARAQALPQNHPESWLAWVHTAYVAPERACAPELRDHLQALIPDNAHVLSLAATCALQAGQTDQALGLSKRAFSAYPVSPRITLSHAHILQAAGACSELALLQEYALGQEGASPGRATLEAIGPCQAARAP